MRPTAADPVFEDGQPAAHGQAQGGEHHQGRRPREMLADVSQHAPVPLPHHPGGDGAAARPDAMGDFRLRHVNDLLAGVADAAAPVHVLHEQEVAVVEAAHAVEHFATHHEARARHPIHGTRRGVVPVEVEVVAGDGVAREQAGEQRVAAEEDGQGPGKPAAGVLQRPIRVEQAGGHHADRGEGVEVARQRGHRPRVGDGVRVEEQEMATARRGHAEVAGAREADVAAGLDQPGFGEGIERSRPAGRPRVVDDDDLERNRVGGGGKALQAVTEQLFAVVVDDDDRAVGVWRGTARRSRPRHLGAERHSTPLPPPPCLRRNAGTSRSSRPPPDAAFAFGVLR